MSAKGCPKVISAQLERIFVYSPEAANCQTI